MNAHAHVEEWIKQAQDIREAVAELAEVQDKALLASFGIGDIDSDDSTGEDVSVLDADSECESVLELENDGDSTNTLLSDEWVKSTLKLSRYKWFEFCERAEECTGKPQSELETLLDKIFQGIPIKAGTQHNQYPFL